MSYKRARNPVKIIRYPFRFFDGIGGKQLQILERRNERGQDISNTFANIAEDLRLTQAGSLKLRDGKKKHTTLIWDGNKLRTLNQLTGASVSIDSIIQTTLIPYHQYFTLNIPVYMITALPKMLIWDTELENCVDQYTVRGFYRMYNKPLQWRAELIATYIQVLDYTGTDKEEAYAQLINESLLEVPLTWPGGTGWVEIIARSAFTFEERHGDYSDLGYFQVDVEGDGDEAYGLEYADPNFGGTWSWVGRFAKFLVEATNEGGTVDVLNAASNDIVGNPQEVWLYQGPEFAEGALPPDRDPALLEEPFRLEQMMSPYPTNYDPSVWDGLEIPVPITDREFFNMKLDPTELHFDMIEDDENPSNQTFDYILNGYRVCSDIYCGQLVPPWTKDGDLSFYPPPYDSYETFLSSIEWGDYKGSVAKEHECTVRIRGKNVGLASNEYVTEGVYRKRIHFFAEAQPDGNVAGFGQNLGSSYQINDDGGVFFRGQLDVVLQVYPQTPDGTLEITLKGHTPYSSALYATFKNDRTGDEINVGGGTGGGAGDGYSEAAAPGRWYLTLPVITAEVEATEAWMPGNQLVLPGGSANVLIQWLDAKGDVAFKIVPSANAYCKIRNLRNAEEFELWRNGQGTSHFKVTWGYYEIFEVKSGYAATWDSGDNFVDHGSSNIGVTCRDA